MASIRGEIHINEVERFKSWLGAHAWVIDNTREVNYEVIFARREKEILIFYKRDHSAHLSCSLESHYLYWVSKYRLDMRKQKAMRLANKRPGWPVEKN